MAKQSSNRRLRGATKKATKAKRRAPKPAGHSERTLHMLGQQWLAESGYWAKLLIFHVPNERRGGPGVGAHFKRMGVRPGVADYLVFGCTKDAAIEWKDAGGAQREDQIRFQRDWEACGKLYFIVRTLEEFQGVVTGLALFC